MDRVVHCTLIQADKSSTQAVFHFKQSPTQKALPTFARTLLILYSEIKLINFNRPTPPDRPRGRFSKIEILEN